MMIAPRIAIPVPTYTDALYNDRCWPQYAEAVQLSGGFPVKVRLGLEPAAVAQLAAGCSGILLPGSPADLNPQKYGAATGSNTAASDARREAVDELLLQDAFNLQKPLLGICYGYQAMNVWRGGSLVQHVISSVDHAPAINGKHGLVLSPESIELARAFASDPLLVNSSHHQAVAASGDGLVPAAWCLEDGLLEAVESLRGYAVGVQWHPERTFHKDAASRQIFESFVQAASEWSVDSGLSASLLRLDPARRM